MGSWLLYYLVLIPISRLPFFALYALSDFAFFVLYRLVGYRKKVVLKNIQNSFPEKSEKEQKQIMKDFYKHFCDLIVESIKGFTISEKKIAERVVFRNHEILKPFYDQGRDIVMVGGHYNNWEYFAVRVGSSFGFIPLGIYKPLSNKFFDRKMRQSRERYGLRMTPMKQTYSSMQTDMGKPKATIFGADQSPSNPRRCYWTTFLNQDTAVFYGPEKLAKEFDLPVTYSVIRKVKRGFYAIEHEIITETPRETPYGFITEAHVKNLERDIRLVPQYWLWTHKRWKHKRPAPEEMEVFT